MATLSDRRARAVRHPELPAGENPPPGAILDYFLPSDASGPVKLEILDSAGAVVRTLSSEDPVANPHPALDPAAYNKVCQQNPSAPDCGLPLYWPAPPMVIETTAGMHRVSWDMRYQPIGEGGGRGGGGAAVPHRTYPGVNAPWAVPGSYSVRLTVNGKSSTQPLTVKLDPRVKTPPLALTQLTTLTKEMYDGARAAHAAAEQARALVSQLESAQGDDAANKVEGATDRAGPPAPAGGGGRGGRGAASADTATLDSVSAAMMGAAMAMQGAEAAPTAREVAACADARRQSVAVMAKWTKLKADVAALNAKRKTAGQPAIVVPKE